ncbi:anti-sigma-K factor rskA [Prosthecobacter fusiformis]|uniref:Regulator of SigK n=1 Tax=Prosthecobacter fusiformis TaxID=48464 RepID=A0A4R7RMN1_9BACT|nr:anti-sigma factor [Prosthecobacter fusiformis]TDU64234.1 anti-sigma-K factor rskA [Prosthecobacter fusiformis]
MDEEHEELAALNALHALDEAEQSVFDIELARSSELRHLATELEVTAAALAAAVPPVKPRADLKKAIMAQVRERQIAKKKSGKKARMPRRFGVLPWGIAAVLGAGCFWLWMERNHLKTQVLAMSEVEMEARQQMISVRDERDALEEKAVETARKMETVTAQIQALREDDERVQQQVVALTQEITALRQKDAFAQVQIATLQSSVAAYQQGVAVVVWDSEKHQGVLKLEKMPPVETGKDYQLWVVDPKNPVPVDAGVVQVDAQGFAKVDFKPVDAVSSAAKFALSIEREGGVPKGEGPIILIGP